MMVIRMYQGHWKTFRGGVAKSKRGCVWLQIVRKLYSHFAWLDIPKNMIVHIRTWKVWWHRLSTLTVALFR